MNSNYLNILYVAIGGACGAILRYLFYVFFANTYIATMIVNLLGCFLIGVLSTIYYQCLLNNLWYKPLVLTGFLGCFTTFSSFCLLLYIFIQQQEFVKMLLYGSLQVFIGVFLVIIAHFLTMKFI